MDHGRSRTIQPGFLPRENVRSDCWRQAGSVCGILRGGRDVDEKLNGKE